MPATAAIDNETLDHLLSVVDDSGNLKRIRELSKPCAGALTGMQSGVADYALVLQASAAFCAAFASFLVL